MAFPLVFVSAPRWRGAKYLQNSGFFRPTVFFSAAHARGVVSAKKKKGTLWLKKLPKISNQWSPAASDTVKGLCKHKDLFLWHRGSIVMIECLDPESCNNCLAFARGSRVACTRCKWGVVRTCATTEHVILKNSERHAASPVTTVFTATSVLLLSSICSRRT